LSADELIRAIRDNNLVKLVAVPGVGKKTAERLVVELRDKMTKLAAGLQAEPVASDYTPATNAMSDDIVSALINLGYQKAAAEKAVANVSKENADANFETALKLALRHLAR
jgi:holliday junction DNA helicase RuvA